MKYIIKIYLLLIISVAIISCGEERTDDTVASKKHPNVILLIGDGMGLSQLSAAFYYGKSESNFARFKEVGLIVTSSAIENITDSGAGGTAFANGEKTYNGAIGVNLDSVAIPNLVEVLSKKGYNTGIISTSSVTHATPACFYAHVVDRGMQDKIAEQLVDSEIDFFAGGGTSFFSNRKDSLDLIKKLSENGFVVKTDTTSKKLDHDNKYGFLLAENGMPTMLESRGDFLPEYTKLALDLFSQQQKSFFLMVEGSQIDWAGHEGNADYLIAEVLDFDKTVGVAMDFAANNNNTLVIVLADHETGGFTLAIKDGDYSIIKPTFASSGHSCTLIPVLASGPGAESFKGIYQNNEIFHKILAVTN
ncbi:MAG: alkaline phosphatase [Bacteroidetes bacterium]|jgi:alkaline phosphatase|nr:alkaline phosphatase [Bacteroidota bacterium]|tara:strand:+ start:344 stop:1429 length:1086 start_codon:yes stop_codon:yes gene_type:complete